MIRPESKALLEQLSHTQFGHALQEYLDEEYAIINDVAACTSWEDAKARALTLKSLERLFSFMRGRDPTAKTKNPYL